MPTDALWIRAASPNRGRKRCTQRYTDPAIDGEATLRQPREHIGIAEAVAHLPVHSEGEEIVGKRVVREGTSRAGRKAATAGGAAPALTTQVCLSISPCPLAAVCGHVALHEPQRVVHELATAQRIVADGQAEARQTIHALRDTSTFAQPLPIVIQPLIDELRAAGIATTPTVLGTPRALNPHETWELFRAVGEALANIRKHVAATTVDVVLDYRHQAAFRLTIRDNGCSTRNPVYGTGLIGMREREELLGGTLRIVTAPQQGWMLMLEVPR